MTGSSAVAPPVARTVHTESTIWPLARIEARRYARHPLFLVGLVLAAIFTATENGPIQLDYQVIPAFFIGVLGLVVASRLTSSLDRSESVVQAAPASQTKRTAALCLACLVPATAGLLLVVERIIVVSANPYADWMYGPFGPADRIVITAVLPIIASAGGPLLGVAVGRWLRFPGAALLAMVVLLIWSSVGAYTPEQSMDADSTIARIIHLVVPYTAWGTGNGNGSTPTSIRSYTGSPVWFAIWTLALCALAAISALMYGTEGRARSIARRAFALAAVIAVAALVLTVATGNAGQFDTTPAGSTHVGQS